MNTATQTLTDLLELVNHYPSPHNGQPIRVKPVGDNQLELYFEKQRGLQAVDISYIFSFVSMGVFSEHLRQCAAALGHEVDIQLSLPTEADLHGEGLVLFGTCELRWNVHQPEPTQVAVIEARQTSRKKYFEGISPSLTSAAVETAQANGMKLVQLPPEQANQAIWLNQRAVFDDMFDEPVRQELNKWLRYDHQQKITKRDGLSYDCMELNGRLLKYTVDHPKILRAPILSSIIEQYYLHTMKDKSGVFYMMAPFGKEADAYAVGTVIMKIWLQLSAQGYYLHPFGTIMSNHQAHADFLQLVGEHNESRSTSYLVFIFRAGKSKPPVRSERIPTNEHLIVE